MPSVEEDAAVFERSFLEAADLEHITWAARRVLAMSAALFYRQGAAATSVRDITRACGLSPGALYNHFASKDELLDVLVRHGHTRLETRIGTALSGTDPCDAIARVEAFVCAYVTGHLEQPQLAQVVRREYLHLPRERNVAIVRRRRRLRKQLSDLLLAGDASGDFDLVGGTAGATGVAVMILDMCSRTSEWYDPRRSEPPERLTARYMAAALRLAGAQTRVPQP